MEETKLLLAMVQSREAYDTITSVLDRDDFQGLSAILFTYISEFYSNDKDVKAVDVDVLISKLTRKNPKLAEAATSVLTRAEEPLSIPNIVEEVVEYKKYTVGLRLSSALIEGSSNKIAGLLEQYNAIAEGDLGTSKSSVPEAFVGESIDSLIATGGMDSPIKLYPLSLNERVGGGVCRGTSIAFFARPETGKSLFGINQAALNCKDGYRVLYIGNEDPHPVMLLRFISRLTGLTRNEILQDTKAAFATAIDNGYKNLIFSALSPGTLQEIEALVKYYSPDVVVVDQARNINTNSDGLVASLEKVGAGIRNIGKKYNLVSISITQAGDTASNKLVLTMSDVDSSKTGFPAAFDVMVGIGMNETFDAQNQRMLSLAKNKLTGDHGYFPVVIDKQLSKVRSM